MESDVLDIVQSQVRAGDEGDESTEQNIVEEGEYQNTAAKSERSATDRDEIVKDGEQSKLGPVSESSVSASRVSTKYDPGPPPMDMIGGESRDSSGSSTKSQQQS